MTSRREEQGIVFQAADRIRQLGLHLPAQLVLEAGRPLAFVAGQFVWLAQPFLGLLMPRAELARVAEMLEDPESVGALIELLGREAGESGEEP